VATVIAPRANALWDSSVGKKILMALSGLILYGFVIGHMVGNLKVYFGAAAFNHYAEGLRTFGEPFFARGQVLWLVRLVLIACLLVHVVAAFQLTLKSKRARKQGYKKYDGLEFSYASRTIFHLLDLTFGTVNPAFVPGNAYANFVSTFQRVPVSIAYIAAMVPLALHLYHGFWSMLQTLGANNPKYNRMRRPVALTLAVLIALGNISFPVAVLLGIVK
jgi:succinate dehydrogenase / fumarate reductase cytochrome b subunit